MANCGIMRIEKRKAKDTYGIEKENNRNADNQIELVASDIDWDRTEQNYYFLKAKNFKKTIDEELHKNGIEKHRKDAVLMLDGLYTASPEFFQDKTKEEIIQYFSKCLEFHKRNYGQVINAVIHFDESNPHLHVQSIPLIKKEDKIKLSAFEIMGNKIKYHKMQDKFYEEVSSLYGLERGEIKDSEHQREHLTSLEYKVKMQALALAEKEKIIKEQESIIYNNSTTIREQNKIIKINEKEIKRIKEVLEKVLKLSNDIFVTKIIKDFLEKEKEIKKEITQNR